MHLLFSHRTITLIYQSVLTFGSLKKVNLKSLSAANQRQKLGSGRASRAALEQIRDLSCQLARGNIQQLLVKLDFPFFGKDNEKV